MGELCPASPAGSRKLTLLHFIAIPQLLHGEPNNTPNPLYHTGHSPDFLRVKLLNLGDFDCLDAVSESVCVVCLLVDFFSLSLPFLLSCEFSPSLNLLLLRWRKVILQRDSRQDLVKYGVIAFGVSGIAALLPLTTSSYGSAGGWCWITSTGNSVLNKGNLWRFVLFYLPLWLVITFNFISYIWVIKSIRRLMKTQPIESHQRYDKMMRR